ncbi:MAG: flippase-like domain-containing protein [Gemmatimonadaceae bacterium]|nr:flippase-like domain-containing protein [Gemmatimonadaceae bacterium]
MRATWRVAQALFVLAVLGFAARLVARHWAELRALSASLTPAWGAIAWSCGIVLVSYAVLIATWQAMLRAWGSPIGALDGARIWFVSNLGRYLPGKVWQIAAMGVMAQRVGVAPEAAVGSSLVIAVVNILAGFSVAALTGAETYRLLGIAGPALWGPIVLLVVGTLSLPWTLAPALRLLGRLTKRQIVEPRLPVSAIAVAFLGCALAWALYGVAFQELSIGLIPGAGAGEAGPYVAVFTLSYLAGFLALFAPGGIGVREVSLGALLVGTGLSTAAEATVLVLASRLWLTLLEILPGLMFLAWPRSRATLRESVPPTT